MVYHGTGLLVPYTSHLLSRARSRNTASGREGSMTTRMRVLCMWPATFLTAMKKHENWMRVLPDVHSLSRPIGRATRALRGCFDVSYGTPSQSEEQEQCCLIGAAKIVCHTTPGKDGVWGAFWSLDPPYAPHPGEQTPDTTPCSFCVASCPNTPSHPSRGFHQPADGPPQSCYRDRA